MVKDDADTAIHPIHSSNNRSRLVTHERNHERDKDSTNIGNAGRFGADA